MALAPTRSRRVGRALLSAAWLPFVATVQSPQAPSTPIPWDAGAAAHLLDRAGFGATREEIDEAARIGLDATLERLFRTTADAPDADTAPPYLPGRLLRPEELVRQVDERRRGSLELHSDFIRPLAQFGNAWIERMIAGTDPLRDHMTLFWHGHFTSSFRDLDDPYKMIAQIRFLRANALGRFDVLVRGIARDPAMLMYLSNNKNVQDHPNENWARELMELFTLGEGNYTEVDVKEVSRAFTGWTDDDDRFGVRYENHDEGSKTVLGVTGDLDGEDVVDILLAQPACGRHLARKLLSFFEGAEPNKERIEAYASFLRSNGYDVRAFLDRMFRDPAFYRAEIRGRRVAGPVEFLVGAARRLGVHVPGPMLASIGDLCGQRIFYPPSVKGWDQGLAWITTGSLLQRSNGVGILLGLVDVESLKVDAEFAGSAMTTERPVANSQALTSGLTMLRAIQAAGWEPDVSLQRSLVAAGAGESDVAIADALLRKLLPSSVSAPTREIVLRFLRDEREKVKLAPSDLLRPHAGDRPEEGERLLRRVAHLILSLPEAQLD